MFILDLEDVVDSQLPIITLRPKVLIVASVDQLDSDPQAVLRAAYAAFENEADTELATDLFDIDWLILVAEGRIAGDYEQVSEPGQSGDDVFGDRRCEVRLLGIVAQIAERQDGDRGLVG